MNIFACQCFPEVEANPHSIYYPTHVTKLSLKTWGVDSAPHLGARGGGQGRLPPVATALSIGHHVEIRI